MVIVQNQKEFEKALERREKQIVYEGPDAEKILAEIKKAEDKKASARKWGWGIAALALMAAPFTGGTSLLGLTATAATVALSEGAIIAIITGIAAISVEAIRALKEYEVAKENTRRVILTHK